MSALTQTTQQRDSRIVTQPLYSAKQVQQLKAAMCPSSMMEVLEHDWLYPKRHGLILDDCEAVRVYPRGNDEFVIEYQMRFRSDDGQHVERMFGELVGDTTETRYRQLLEALMKKRRRQIQHDATTELIACVPSLRMILRFPGLDEKLHGLKLAHDQKVLRSILSRHLPEQHIKKGNIDIKVLGHRLGKRCVIRYRPAPDDDKLTGGKKPSTSLIAKIYKTRERRGHSVFAAMQRLASNGFGKHAEDGIRIPALLEYIDDLQMLLMEDVPGALPSHTGTTGFEAAGEPWRNCIAPL